MEISPVGSRFHYWKELFEYRKTKEEDQEVRFVKITFEDNRTFEGVIDKGMVGLLKQGLATIFYDAREPDHQTHYLRILCVK